MFHLKSRRVPNSTKGREITRLLKSFGFAVRHRDVLGKYVMNLICFDELTFDQKRQLAYALDPKSAFACEKDAEDLSNTILDSPTAYRLTESEAERCAQIALQAWLS